MAARLHLASKLAQQCRPAVVSRRWHSTTHTTDSCGIPTRPTWSVNELLSSYPRPTIPSATLKRLHELSALVPPKEGTPEHEYLRAEMEDLVKLVEAVKLVDTSEVIEEHEVPDGRIWAKGAGIELEGKQEANSEAKTGFGQDLLKHAAKTSNGMYIVESEKMK